MSQVTSSAAAHRLWATIRRKVERDIAAESAAAEQLRSDVVSGARAIATAWVQQGRAGAVWLFGSMAGDAWARPDAESDVDILVAGCADPQGLAVEVGRRVHRPVHVVARETAEIELVARVEREGVGLASAADL
jgi:predicted nucleotidyltransferase